MSARMAAAAAALGAAELGAAACRPAAPRLTPEPAPAPAAAQAAASQAEAARATVAQVLDGRVPAGRLVRVRGRCLGYGGRSAEGPPPRSRSDWLLGDGGRAVYVAGAFPPGCEPMGGGPDLVAVVGRVTVDTVAGLGGPGAPRRYLVGRPAGAP